MEIIFLELHIILTTPVVCNRIYCTHVSFFIIQSGTRSFRQIYLYFVVCNIQGKGSRVPTAHSAQLL